MNRKLVYLLLICFSLSILGLSFHYHADGAPHHDDCSLCCHVLRHSLLIPQDSPQISLLTPNVLFISIENTANISYQCYHLYSNRAPPA
jgi:hypothetical protein